MDRESKPWIVDTTLRDGEQAAGVVFSPRERLRIAEGVAETGVAEIEAGTPAMGDAAVRSIRAIADLHLPVRISAWCRARESDIEDAARSGADVVHVSVPASALHMRMLEKTEEGVMDAVFDAVTFGRRFFDSVSVGAQDASRADLRFLTACCIAAREAGAHRFRVADTVGVLDPPATAGMFGILRRHAGGMALGFHGHNDLGMATANTVTALSSGGDGADVTVNGLGERAGNAPLAEVLMALRVRRGEGCAFRTEGLTALSRFVAKASNRPLPADKPVVGAAVFRHESGIHVDGVLASPTAYEPFSPERCGAAERDIVVGTHSGTAAIRHVLSRLGVGCDRSEAARLLPAVRALSASKKRGLREDELLALWRHAHGATALCKATG